MTTVDTKPLKLGVIGIGVGAAEMLPPMERAPYIDLFAGADVNPSVRERFQARYETARVYDSAEALCKDPDVEAVWISTPNRFHGPMTVMAANHGKHVVVEKPMALNIREAEEMVEACDRNGRQARRGAYPELHAAHPPHAPDRGVRRDGSARRGERHRLHGLGHPPAHGRRVGPRSGRRTRLPADAAPDRQHPAHRGRQGAERARGVRPVDEVPFHPRLLRRVPGVRERRNGRGHPQRLRLLRRVGARAVGRREHALHAERAERDPQVDGSRDAPRGRGEAVAAHRRARRSRPSSGASTGRRNGNPTTSALLS